MSNNLNFFEYIIMKENKESEVKYQMVKTILSISTDDETGYYSIEVANGSNVAETMFAVSAMIKCFVRDGVIEDAKIATDMLQKYLTDSQYDEMEETK